MKIGLNTTEFNWKKGKEEQYRNRKNRFMENQHLFNLNYTFFVNANLVNS